MKRDTSKNNENYGGKSYSYRRNTKIVNGMKLEHNQHYKRSGKGLKATRNLTAEQLEDFDTVKARVLKSYHVHCEAYRNTFFSATFDGDFDKGLELKQTFSDWVETSKLPMTELVPMELLLQKLPGWLQNRVRTSEPTSFENFLGKVQIARSTTTSSSRGKPRWMEQSTGQPAEGKSGANSKEELKPAEPRRTTEARCFKCNQKGHLKRDCPRKCEASVHRMEVDRIIKH